MSKSRTRTSVTTFFLLVTVLISLELASIGEVRGDYTVAVSGSSVSVNITTIFSENLTDVTLPIYNLTLSGSNASTAIATMSSALDSMVPGAAVSMLTITSESTANMTRIDLHFNVGGIVTSSNGQLKINMAWKSFDVTSDITNGTISLNLVGQYLANSQLLNQRSSTLTVWNYFVDGTVVPFQDSIARAASINLLDFSHLSTPLESWPHEFNLTNGGTTILTNAESHSLAIRETFNEGGSPFTDVFSASFSHNVQFSIAGSPTVIGDTVILDANNSIAVTMVGIIVAALATIVLVFVIERRINKSGRALFKKKDRSRQKK